MTTLLNPPTGATPPPTHAPDQRVQQVPARAVTRAPLTGRYREVLTPDAITFLTDLHTTFSWRRAELLAAQQARAEYAACGHNPGFSAETAEIRDDPTWRVPNPPPGLTDRRVEITGPPTPKMTVNALNSGASVWMADFEDASSPTWAAMVEGQLTLIDALTGRLDFTVDGKHYRVGDQTPTVVMRPRGWHLCERHLTIDGASMSASLFDAGLYLWHNAARLIARGAGPYLYLPKLESAAEAALWHDVFCFVEDRLALQRGTIRATVLIETIWAAFQMEEILHALGEHAAGLNAGRWDYIFSVLKTFRTRGTAYLLPDRSAVTMTAPFMRAYARLLVQTCHRRGAMAIGGMAAFIPERSDPEATEQALRSVRADKEREAGDGFDGSWVAHPGLVPICRDVFDAALGERPDQRDRIPDGPTPTERELLDFASTPGGVTLAGLRRNISVSLRYLDAWLQGNGAVAIDHLMEDTATVEISRMQLWQWRILEPPLIDGGRVTGKMIAAEIDAEHERLSRWNQDQPASRLGVAVDILRELVFGPEFQDNLTVRAYARHLASAH
jgi:malate synthase